MIHLLRCVVAAGREFVLPLGRLHPRSLSSQLATHSDGDSLKFREDDLQPQSCFFKSLRHLRLCWWGNEWYFLSTKKTSEKVPYSETSSCSKSGWNKTKITTLHVLTYPSSYRKYAHNLPFCFLVRNNYQNYCCWTLQPQFSPKNLNVCTKMEKIP